MHAPPRAWAFLLLALALPPNLSGAPLRIPAYTAYTEPESGSVRVSERNGLTGWTNPNQRVLWFGTFKQPGPLDVSLDLRLPSNTVSQLRLTIGDQTQEATARGQGTNDIRVSFPTFQIQQAGPQRLALQATNASRRNLGELTALWLDGAAASNAHFNLKSRRNAASVHLRYPAFRGTNVAAFYCEVTGVEEPVTTFYMACGWHRGYFGMQVNSPRERRIIFSVWDSGNEAVSRARVADENRVTLMGKGDGVVSGDFGNEGTGGHSHLKYRWKTGEPQRFLVTAQPTNQTFTIFSGYWFHPEQQRWMLISSWRAPKDGGWLRGLHSFSENFGGSTGHQRRKALYGNQWIRTDSGEWIEITNGSFSHDTTGRADRLDRFMGVEGGQFFLSHGGFIPGFTAAGESFNRVPTGRKPTVPDLPLPGSSR